MASVICHDESCVSHLLSQELETDAHVKEGHAGAVTLRAFRNAAGSLRSDASEGCDSAAVQQGWVAVTPIGLRSDVPVTAEGAPPPPPAALVAALAWALQAGAASLGGARRRVSEEAAGAYGPSRVGAGPPELQPEAVAVGSAV